ncbi:MAG: UvrD-helicase domain-containing protein, partial [Candidatus Thermoplasmatota archaeon]|nr:UvrD-helicase domain-containing protein [Candidatus Thermoplasmatota archaeon]
MNICYSAGPGSGKTKTLVEEFGRAIEKADIGSVVAVTFTDKAANEMVERIAKKEKSRFMEFITSNRIGTIHSFCLSILKGYMPVTDIMDDKLSAVLKEKAVDLCLSESMDELLLDNFDFDDLKKSLRASLEKRFDKREYTMDEESYIAMNDKTLLGLTAESIGAIRDLDNGELRNFIDHNKLLNYGSLSLGEKLSVIEKIAGIDCNKIKGMAGAKKELKDIMDKTMLTSENYESLLSYERAVLIALLNAFEKVNSTYEEIKEGRLDFDDILIKTYRLLKDSPRSVEIGSLFVDEFQDVDPLQYRIMELLQQRNREMSIYV